MGAPNHDKDEEYHEASTNPSTGDLKEEFSSGFGSDYGVRETFKNWDFDMKEIFIALAILALGGVGGFFFKGLITDPIVDEVRHIQELNKTEIEALESSNKTVIEALKTSNQTSIKALQDSNAALITTLTSEVGEVKSGFSDIKKSQRAIQRTVNTVNAKVANIEGQVNVLVKMQKK